jgi:hypothetical protein
LYDAPPAAQHVAPFAQALDLTKQHALLGVGVGLHGYGYCMCT